MLQEVGKSLTVPEQPTPRSRPKPVHCRPHTHRTTQEFMDCPATTADRFSPLLLSTALRPSHVVASEFSCDMAAGAPQALKVLRLWRARPSMLRVTESAQLCARRRQRLGPADLARRVLPVGAVASAVWQRRQRRPVAGAPATAIEPYAAKTAVKWPTSTCCGATGQLIVRCGCRKPAPFRELVTARRPLKAAMISVYLKRPGQTACTADKCNRSAV